MFKEENQKEVDTHRTNEKIRVSYKSDLYPTTHLSQEKKIGHSLHHGEGVSKVLKTTR